MAVILTVRRQVLTALARRSSYGFSLPVVASQVGALALVMVLAAGGRVGFTKFGLMWAPVAAAAGVAATIYLLFEFKLAHFRASIELEELP